MHLQETKRLVTCFSHQSMIRGRQLSSTFCALVSQFFAMINPIETSSTIALVCWYPVRVSLVALLIFFGSAVHKKCNGLSRKGKTYSNMHVLRERHISSKITCLRLRPAGRSLKLGESYPGPLLSKAVKCSEVARQHFLWDSMACFLRCSFLGGVVRAKKSEHYPLGVVIVA